MSRLLLIAVLLMHPLVAPAAMADMTCMHALSGQNSEHSPAMHHMAPHGHAAQGSGQSNCDCGCAIAGHCGGSAISAIPRAAGIDLSVRGITPTKGSDALAIGYRTPPYRPPSATA